VDITIEIPQGVERVLMLGPGEGNLKMIRETLGVKVSARDGIVRVGGNDEAVCTASIVLGQLGAAAARNRTLSPVQLQRALEAARRQTRRSGREFVTNGESASWKPEENGDRTYEPLPDRGLAERGVISDAEAWGDQLDVYAGGRPVEPRTAGQQKYLEAMQRHDLVFATGPAGTGKTYLAVAAAVHLLKVGRIRRICLVRPAVEAGERLGFLPGDLQQKVNPYLRPLLDALHDMMDFGTIRRFMANDIIEIAPLAFMRGRTLNEGLIILDEAQNTTRGQMKMFLTRLGHQSKMVVVGDTSQIDLEEPADSGLLDAIRRLEGVPGIATIRLRKSDIVRHDLVQRIVDAYSDRADDAPGAAH
jgi:phosphate starvation-inducible PhoH-like protein